MGGTELVRSVIDVFEGSVVENALELDD